MTEAAPPIVALVHGEATAPVVVGQIPPLLAALAKLGRRVDAAWVTPARALMSRASRDAHRAAASAFRAATGTPPMRRTSFREGADVRSLGRRLAADLAARGLAESVLLCRRPRAAVVGIAARERLERRGGGRLRVVLLQRGIEDAEYLVTLGRGEADLTPPERRRLARIRFEDELACRRADAVLTASRPMQRFLLKRYAIEGPRVGRVPHHAVPVADADRRRGEARAELGVAAGDLVVAWCGTLSAWQMPQTVLEVFEGVRAVRADARLLLLTPDVETIGEVAQRSGVSDAIVRSAPPSDVARLLCAADYGLVLRDDHIVNRVACPVVFGEYLASGARPVVSPHLGDQSELCHETGIGVVVGLGKPSLAGRMIGLDSQRPGTLDAAAREKRRTWARDNISPEPIALRALEFLDQALGDLPSAP